MADFFRSSTLDESASGVWWAPEGRLPFYRPIGLLTFAADYQLWGFRPFGFHLINVIVHVVCTALAWRLALRLFHASTPAFAVAAIFALHPVHTEAVSWISGRFDLLVCVCAISSVLSYLNWKDRGSFAWGLASAFSFLVGLGCKETALVLPVVLISLEWHLPRSPRRPFRLAAMLLMFGFISSGYLAIRTALFGSALGSLPPPYGLDTSTPLAALLNIAANSAQYVLDLALLIPVDPAYGAPFWRQHPMLLGAALAASALHFTWIAARGWSRVFGFGLSWLLIFTAPSLLSMPGERNIYLAGVGLAFLYGAVFAAALARTAGRSPEERPSAAPRWLRRTSWALIVMGCALCVVKQELFGRIAGAAEKEYHDLQTVLPDPPPDARIYVVNQNPLNSVGFTQALRLHYGRRDLSGCALSLSPTLIASSRDRISAMGPDSIRLTRTDGTFLTSFVDRFHRFAQPISTLADACRRAGLELVDPPSSDHGITILRFRFPHPLSDPRINIFHWDNERVRNRWDIFRMSDLTMLKYLSPRQGGSEP